MAIPKTPPPLNKSNSKKVKAYSFNNIVLKEKLRNPVGFMFLALCSIFFALVLTRLGMLPGILILVATIALPICYAIVAYPQFGVTVLLVMAYFIMWIISFNLVGDFPLGTMMDALEALLILGFFIHQKKRPNWEIFKNPISIIILIWVSYNIIEFINPITESRMAWLYTIRTTALIMLMYFIFSYHIRTVVFIRFIFKSWLAMALFAAIYAYKQEHFGFFAFEESYLSDPLIRNLLFIDGHWRVFSIFAEPVSFSLFMVVSSLLCICLIFGPVSNPKKIILAALVWFFLQTMLYSGTRSAYPLIPAGMMLFAILTYNKKLIYFYVGCVVFFVFTVIVPTNSQSIIRYQSAFKPSNDASFIVRKVNQDRMTSYIQTHPLGGGLGATGMWGARFAPNSFLAQIPPDSGYFRVALELGWVGLLIFCTLMFIILKTGITNYYRMKDPELKSYCLAMVLIVYAYSIGNYPQEAIVQFPANIYFYLVTALINITYNLDLKKQELKENEQNTLLDAGKGIKTKFSSI